MRPSHSSVRRITLLAATLSPLVAASCVDDDDELATESEQLSTGGGSHRLWRVTDNYLSRQPLLDRLDAIDDAGTDIDAMATTAVGHWFIVADDNRYNSSGAPAAVVDAIDDLLDAGQHIRAIDFNANGGWIVVGSSSRRSGGSLPSGLTAKLAEYDDNGWAVRDVDLTNSGWVILGSGSLATYAGIDSNLANAIFDRRATKRTIQALDIGFDGRWALVSGQEPATEDVTDQLSTRLRSLAEDELFASRFMFGVGDNYVLYSHGNAVPNLGNVAEKIEYDLGAGSDNLWERMTAAGVPGVSIAIVEDHELTFARGYGILREGDQRNVLATTPFDLASLSKFLGALTVVRLDQLGTVDLDTDILTNPGAMIASWQTLGEAANATTEYGIPNIDLPAGMTLRRLMRHSAGIRAEGGSPGVHSTNWDELPFDYTDQLLGWMCSSTDGDCDFKKTKYVWTDGTAPGGMPNYASGNFLVAEVAVRDATGNTGWQRMQSQLVTPLGLTDTSGQHPLPTAFEARAAWQHGDSGAVSQRTVYPWTFAGGVYASASDYARMMILALNAGRDENGVARIGSANIAEMLVSSNNYGLGLLFEGASATEGSDRTFRHGGSHGGRARTAMCGNPTRGDGIVILTNANTADVDDLVNDILEAFVAAKGWPNGNCH